MIVKMLKNFFLIIIYLLLTACNLNKNVATKNFDNEQLFAFKAQSNLYFLKGQSKKTINFIEYANHEYLVKNKVKEKCLNFIKDKKIKQAQCKFMGSKFTERLERALD